MTTTALDLEADTIKLEDVFARFEELQSLVPATEQEKWENCDEYATLLELMDCLSDEPWCDDWNSVTLVADHYFTEYIRELFESRGDIPQELSHDVEIDWTTTARNIRMDYYPIEINGATYWYR